MRDAGAGYRTVAEVQESFALDLSRLFSRTILTMSDVVEEATLCSRSRSPSSPKDKDMAPVLLSSTSDSPRRFIVDWEVDDPGNPRNFPNALKWRISMMGIVFCGIVSSVLS